MMISSLVVNQITDRVDAVRKINVKKDEVIKPCVITILSYIFNKINKKAADDVTMEDGRDIDSIPVLQEFDWAIAPRSVRLISGDRIAPDMLDRDKCVRIQPDQVEVVTQGDPEDPQSYDSETTVEEAMAKKRVQVVKTAGLVKLKDDVTYKEYVDACDEFRRFFKSDTSSGMVTVGSKRIDMSLADALTRVTMVEVDKVATEDGNEIAAAINVKMHINGSDWYYPIRLKSDVYGITNVAVRSSFWNTDVDFCFSELILTKIK